MRIISIPLNPPFQSRKFSRGQLQINDYSVELQPFKLVDKFNIQSKEAIKI